MPFFPSPGRCGKSPVSEPHLRVHFNLALEAGEKDDAAPIFPLSSEIVVHKLTPEALLSVFRKHVEAQKHDIFTLWIVEVRVREKLIPKSILVCG